MLVEDSDNSIQKAHYASKIGELQSLRYKDLLAKKYGSGILKQLHLKDEWLLKQKKDNKIKETHSQKLFCDVENIISDLDKKKNLLSNEFSNIQVRINMKKITKTKRSLLKRNYKTYYFLFSYF